MEPEKKSNGALIGLIIIIIILIVGGLYMWQKNKNVVNETNTQAETWGKILEKNNLAFSTAHDWPGRVSDQFHRDYGDRLGYFFGQYFSIQFRQ